MNSRLGKKMKTVLIREGILSLFEKSVRYVIRHIEALFALVVSRFVSKNPNLAIFDGTKNNEFSDNSKYLFLYLCNNTKIECVWLTDDVHIVNKLSKKGYTAYKRNTLKAKLHKIKANYAVTHWRFSKLNRHYFYSATKIQLWHGIPLKKLSRWDLNWWDKNLRSYDLACVNSDDEAQELIHSMSLDKTVYTGSPRNDVFFNNIKDVEIGVHKDAYNLINSTSGDTLIGYFPTWRKFSEDKCPLDFNSLNKFLHSTDCQLVIKPHRESNLFNDLEGYENIHLLPSEGDIYPILRHIDLLITDYSSIYFDYLLLDRPIIFYPYDYTEYAKQRGFHMKYDDVTPGPKAYTYSELVKVIDDVLEYDRYSERRQQVLYSIVEHTDGNSCERVYKQAFN